MSHQLPASPGTNAAGKHPVRAALCTAHLAVLIFRAKHPGLIGMLSTSQALVLTAEPPGSHQVPALKSPSREKSLEEPGLFSLEK